MPSKAKKQEQNAAKVAELNKALNSYKLSASLDENTGLIKTLFEHVDLIVNREFENPKSGDKFCLFYCDGLVDSKAISSDIIRPLLSMEKTDGNSLAAAKNSLLIASDVNETGDVAELVHELTYGGALLFAEGSDKALIIGSRNFPVRSISEPDSERIIKGPRDGFIESIAPNLSLIRRRLRTNQLKIKIRKMGRKTSTSVAVCYIEDLVEPKILSDLEQRLDRVDIDGILDSNYIVEHIAEKSVFGFQTCGYTEKPDVVTARLLEGRIAIFVDGTPVVLTAPYMFMENFRSSEDYYMGPIYGSFTRLIRIFGFFASIICLGLYVTIVAYHQEILSEMLVINLVKENRVVPFTFSVEGTIMMLIFDILRETGVRMPSQTGQSLSIVGALVIGQAAVAANLVSSAIIIVVGFAGITALLVPKLASSTIICRYFLLFLGSIFGLMGMSIGIFIIMSHLLGLKTFGEDYIFIPPKFDLQYIKDSFFRAPIPSMIERVPFNLNRFRSSLRNSDL
ncbi:MAG: spore germination protein [Oscillospiraceae bacterium]|jgi:spore germination protein KA|nr:spore germination protein [Oscillospiraceae bacterium]